MRSPVWNQIYGAFVLDRRVDLHAIDATPARWRGDARFLTARRSSAAASSPRNDLVENYRVHPRHWLISTQALVLAFQQALLRNPAPGAFHPPPALAPAAAAGRNRRRAKMLMVRKKTKSYANAQGIKAVSTKRPLGVRKR